MILPILLIIGLFFLFLSVELGYAHALLGFFIFLSLGFLVASWIILLINKKWWKFIVSLLVSVFFLLISPLPLAMAAGSGPDSFGKRHPIPEGLAYNIPLERDYPNIFTEAKIDSLDTDSYLQIWGNWLGYYYDFYYTSLPAGAIFLRCYEVTENEPLTLSSSIVQTDSVYTFSKLVDKQNFLIYEGDPDDCYAARIEVWHRDRKTQKETKLLEKIYRVEGWAR